MKEVASFKSNDFTASVSAHADLDEDQYDKVKNAMDEELTTGVMATPAKRPKPTPPPQKKPHEVFSRLSKAKQGMGQALKKVKDSVDKVSRDLKQFDDVKVKLVNKGWPQSLADHLETEATVVRDLAGVHKTYWAAETVLDHTELPLKLNGREDVLDEAQLEAVEARVTAVNEKAKDYTTKKNELDKSLRTFITTHLQQTIKII